MGNVINMSSGRHRRRIEKVMAIQFDPEIWRSSSRIVFNEKFNYAERRIKTAISEGKIVIRRPKDIFGKRKAHFRCDPLTKRDTDYAKRYYYFDAVNCSGLILEIENDIRDKWKHDKGKKQYWDFTWFRRTE